MPPSLNFFKYYVMQKNFLILGDNVEVFRDKVSYLQLRVKYQKINTAKYYQLFILVEDILLTSLSTFIYV